MTTDSRPALRTRLEHAIDTRSVRLGAWLLRRTRGRAAHLWRRQALVLTTRGRRSGQLRTVVVQFFPDGDDLIVVAANSGMPRPPAWYLNLRADPGATVQVGASTARVRARNATAAERERLWRLLTAVYPHFDAYQLRTSRHIPVVILSPA